MLGVSNLVGRRKSIYLCLAGAAAVICLINLVFLTHTVDETIVRIPGLSLFRPSPSPPHLVGNLTRDHHPIANLMHEANTRWQQYEQSRSTDFVQTVAKYRETHGRHPPPGFKEWYMFARKNGAHNVDDFEQITSDLRPFWGIPPAEIREMAARLQTSAGIAGVRVRDHEIVSKSEGWRAETLAKSVGRLAKYLPDMDIAMNTMDQPRIMATYDDIQKYLQIEESSRNTAGEAQDKFTSGMDLFYNESTPVNEELDPAWFSVAGRPYMESAKEACPADSPARNDNLTAEDADRLYKSNFGGFVSNFTGSSDLCTVGPVLGDQHGFLFSASSNQITRKLIPVFSECKVSVNNDILFPANMYFLKDERYLYDNKHDYEWEDKTDSMLWRGVTSGGVQVADNWHRLHRQRFVKMANATEMENATAPILTRNNGEQYELDTQFNPSEFASSYFDVGFTEAWGCIPDCSFYEGVWTYKDQKPFSEQFKSKYLVDIDGHSFSGRWRAFHQSRSLGIKATIFREWHDSRLFAWRHFVPMDNRFTDLYTLMTYFIGLRAPHVTEDTQENKSPYIPRHDFEAEVIATQSREWAENALRDEDLDIYLYLLLLEYGRIIDDNRDTIGYSGNGSELAHFDADHPFPPSLQPLAQR